MYTKISSDEISAIPKIQHFCSFIIRKICIFLYILLYIMNLQKRFKLISKDALFTLINRFIDDYSVIAPKKRNNQVYYDHVASADEVELDYKGTPLLPPKRFFFPEREVMFAYELEEGGVRIFDKCDEIGKSRRVLVGVRPCDIWSLKMLDKVFIGEFHDPYYASRRENTIIIGLTCNEPTEHCFCSFTKTGPSINEGFDLLLTDLGEYYLVEVGSETGERLVALNNDLFMNASAGDLKARERILAQVDAEIREQGLPSLTDMHDKMVKTFDAEVWNRYGEKCLSCGKCNFTCPTCRCFDIRDEPSLDLKRGVRVRVWDSCHFLSFTRVASGEVFRKERPSRLKQRIYHKYCYSIDEIGSISCVGCGRCIRVCSAGIDLRKVLLEVNAL